MTTSIVLLKDRALLEVSGEDAKPFLQGLLTCDMEKVSMSDAQAGGLLSPQGKILFDVMVVAQDDGYLVETSASQRGALIKRLHFYKLRAKVMIAARDDLHVYASWGDAPAQGFADPRRAALGSRFYNDENKTTNIEADAYHAHRIAEGIPEAEKDYVLGDMFPHEANFDLLNGVDFDKGCYVGQEVVSRMQHRGTARKRILPFEISGTATPRTPVVAGDFSFGELGSTANGRALALVRLDRLADALANNNDIKAGDAKLTPLQPAWANFKIGGGAV